MSLNESGGSARIVSAMQRFEPDRYYRPQDEDMRLIATAGTLAYWRHRGMGPPYTKLGGRRIVYRGSDLNAWLDAQRVEPHRQVPGSTP